MTNLLFWHSTQQVVDGCAPFSHGNALHFPGRSPYVLTVLLPANRPTAYRWTPAAVLILGGAVSEIARLLLFSSGKAPAETITTPDLSSNAGLLGAPALGTPGDSAALINPLINPLTLCPRRSASACISSLRPLVTLTFISSYALALYFSLALCRALDIAIMPPPHFSVIVSNAIYCVQRTICTDVPSVLGGVFHLANILYSVHHVVTALEP